MNEIKTTYTKKEVTNELVRTVVAQQNAIWDNKEETKANIFQPQDSVTISSEAQMMLERMKEMQEQNKESSEMAEKQGKCMLIAMRIAAGDEVPQSDIKFLIKYNMGLYSKAMQMRIPKPEPEEYDTVLDEEEKKEVEDSGLTESVENLTNSSQSFILE